MSEKSSFDDLLNSFSQALMKSNEEELQKQEDLKKEKENKLLELKQSLLKELEEVAETFKMLLQSEKPLRVKQDDLLRLQSQLHLTIQQFQTNVKLKLVVNQYYELFSAIDGEIKTLERRLMVGDEPKLVKEEVSDVERFKDYNKPVFTQKQILFLMYHLRIKRLFLSDLSDTEFSKALSMMTGMSQEKLRQHLSTIKKEEVEFSVEDRSKLKDILSYLDKEVEKVGGKLK